MPAWQELMHDRLEWEHRVGHTISDGRAHIAAAGAVGADDADEDDVVKQLALDLDGPSSWSLTKLSLNEGTEPRLIGQLGVHTASPTGELLRSRLVAVLFFPCGE